MTNRQLFTIVKSQHPLVVDQGSSVQSACAAMRELRAGSVLVIDDDQRLCGIFTSSDAVRLLASGKSVDGVSICEAMTPSPVTISPAARAVDALRLMSDCGFRHIPVVQDGRIFGIISRNDCLGAEIDRIDEDEHLAACIW
ncbi:MAG: cyclic nucleotide-binding/CBS domain-containing protein [Deltaproteobacteria bacterium]